MISNGKRQVELGQKYKQYQFLSKYLTEVVNQDKKEEIISFSILPINGILNLRVAVCGTTSNSNDMEKNSNVMEKNSNDMEKNSNDVEKNSNVMEKLAKELNVSNLTKENFNYINYRNKKYQYNLVKNNGGETKESPDSKDFTNEINALLMKEKFLARQAFYNIQDLITQSNFKANHLEQIKKIMPKYENIGTFNSAEFLKDINGALPQEYQTVNSLSAAFTASKKSFLRSLPFFSESRWRSEDAKSLYTKIAGIISDAVTNIPKQSSTENEIFTRDSIYNL